MTHIPVGIRAGEQVPYVRAREHELENASYHIVNERVADGPPGYVTPVHATGFGESARIWPRIIV